MAREFSSRCKPQHAWALTIHKFQGSETDTVVYGVSGNRHETWQHVYTAVTRGRKRVVIVGSRKDLHAAVNRKPHHRYA
jgi:DNA helicase B